MESCMTETAVDLNAAARAIVTMAIPERSTELEELWEKHTPVFDKATDTGTFHMEAGPFGLILMTPRSMWISWLLTHEAWAALNCFGTILVILELSPRDVWKHFGEVLRMPGDQLAAEMQADRIAVAVDELRRGIDLAEFGWPSQVPLPRDCRPIEPQTAAQHDLASLVLAAMFLHEVRHVVESGESDEVEPHQSEYRCDAFARAFFMDRISDYSASSGYDEGQVTSKRAIALGIWCYAISRIVGNNTATTSHPSTSQRLRRTLSALSIPADDKFWLVMCSLLLSQLKANGAIPSKVSSTSLRNLAWELLNIVEASSH
jgi:hypothetical protein